MIYRFFFHIFFGGWELWFMNHQQQVGAHQLHFYFLGWKKHLVKPIEAAGHLSIGVTTSTSPFNNYIVPGLILYIHNRLESFHCYRHLGKDSQITLALKEWHLDYGWDDAKTWNWFVLRGEGIRQFFPTWAVQCKLDCFLRNWRKKEETVALFLFYQKCIQHRASFNV